VNILAHALCLSLAAVSPVWAAGNAPADDPAWRHDYGLRAGWVGVLPISASVAAFYEARSDRNWALRPSLEVTKGFEWAIYGDMIYAIDVGRVGAAMDLIYYTSSTMSIGTGFFLTAGVGLHHFDFLDHNKHDNNWNRIKIRDSQSATSYSWGIGYYFGKKFGVEMKYSVSNQDSWLAEGIGRNWLQTTFNYRFPMPGQQRAEHPRDTAYNARKAAQRAEADKLPLWKHKIGVAAGLSAIQEDVAAISVFHESHLGGRWSLRPAAVFTMGSDVYKALDGSGGKPVDIDRIGLSADCLYYASRRRQNGTKFYLLGGLGAYRVAMKDEFGTQTADGMHFAEYSGVVPALSVGMGYYPWRYFGMEYKHTFTTLNSTFPGNVGRNWGQFALNFRFPMPGQIK